MAWNRPSERDQGARKFPFRGLIAGVIVVLGSAVASWWLWSDSKPPPLTSTSTSLIREVTSSARSRPAAQGERTTRSAASLGRADSQERKASEMSVQAATGLQTVSAPVRSISATDQQLAFLAGMMEREGGPPIPGFGGKDGGNRTFLESLKKPIEILPDDDDFVRERKQRLIVLREDMKAMIDGGATFNEVIKEQQKIIAENAETRRNAMRELREIVESGDTEGARKYQTIVNVALQQMGIRELEMPLSKAERETRRLEIYNQRKHEKGN